MTGTDVAYAPTELLGGGGGGPRIIPRGYPLQLQFALLCAAAVAFLFALTCALLFALPSPRVSALTVYAASANRPNILC
eukprot:94154-Rhodomonas_salina.1